MKIGFFDSGIGGLTVLHQALSEVPADEFIYYADTDHVPYGTKSREEIIAYVDSAVNFLVCQEVAAIVIACNTATSAAIDTMRSKYRIPILGMEPAVKVAVKNASNKRIMIIATPLTVREEKLHNLLKQVDEERKVDLLPLPKLVLFAEEGQFNTEEVERYLVEELSRFNLDDYSTLVLGCTHFNYFKDTLRKVLPEDIVFIDGIQGTINHLKNVLGINGVSKEGIPLIQYFKSGREVKDEIERRNLTGYLKRADEMSRFL
ncbi:glutamate racemase [Mobilitalea sibirica]|uniref:Glutamate racemase n=1 Tax=Mobilitalea sibirica TaxID=1462919 RepID=A0A8J7KU05_9FIRM|nr:glutamate racemase [Mobilitalea sibirica]MBH1941931.1 glutamate racemase [Mobilitalea sibirica]